MTRSDDKGALASIPMVYCCRIISSASALNVHPTPHLHLPPTPPPRPPYPQPPPTVPKNITPSVPTTDWVPTIPDSSLPPKKVRE